MAVVRMNFLLLSGWADARFMALLLSKAFAPRVNTSGDTSFCDGNQEIQHGEADENDSQMTKGLV
jgi:hypothetical protein